MSPSLSSAKRLSVERDSHGKEELEGVTATAGEPRGVVWSLRFVHTTWVCHCNLLKLNLCILPQSIEIEPVYSAAIY